MTSANDNQIGGEHYRASYQHWDFITKYGIGYLEGCATKYITRWRKKNGAQDLKKASHYLQKLRELATAGLENRTRVLANDILAFCTANALTEVEASLVFRIVTWREPEDIAGAEQELAELLNESIRTNAGKTEEEVR